MVSQNPKNLLTAGTPVIIMLLLTTVLGGTNQIDILPQMLNFVIYEDMYAPCLAGEITVEDALGMFDKFPICGGETLTISFQSWNYDDNNRTVDQFLRTFDILKITNINQKNDFTKTNTLHFASPELKKNETMRISKTFSNTTFSNIVETIMTSLYDPATENPKGFGFPQTNLAQSITRSKFLTNDTIECQFQKVDANDAIELFIEKTKYSEPFVTIPYDKPFDVIQKLANKSVRLAIGRNGSSQSSDSANFVFFENKRGYQFCSLDTLFENRDITGTRFFYGDAADNNTLGYRAVVPDIIEKLQFLPAYDIIQNMRSGMYSSKLLTYNMQTGEVVAKNYDYAKEFYNTESMERGNGTDYPPILLDSNNQNPLTTKFFTKYMLAALSPNNEIDVITSNPTQRINPIKEFVGVQEYLPKRLSQLSRLQNTRIIIEIAGNSRHKVGDMTYVDIRKIDGAVGVITPVEKPMKYYSGYYLITSIKHIVTLMEYRMQIELCKDSYTSIIGNAPNTTAPATSSSSVIV